MNWKSTAVVSSATVLATWFASAPPGVQPSTPPALSSVPAPVLPDSGVDIAREAERLHVRLRAEAAFRLPGRNPFRFNRVAPARGRVPVTPAPPAAQEVPVAPAAPAVPLKLAGIAEDSLEGQVLRTAIISTPTDVVLAKEGDTVMDVYRVLQIGSESVELTHPSDGSVLRLSFAPAATP